MGESTTFLLLRAVTNGVGDTKAKVSKQPLRIESFQR